MAKQLDKRINDILAKYHDNPRAALWDCHGTWVIYHKDVELMAARAGIKFDAPTIIENNSASKTVAICVTGALGDHLEWSIGEAAPGNNKNSYPYAMAEKRAKDRVALKLLGLHGFIYSEDEMNETAPPRNNDIQSVELKMLLEALEFASTFKDLQDFKNKNLEIIDDLSIDEGKAFVKAYNEHRASLNKKEAA